MLTVPDTLPPLIGAVIVTAGVARIRTWRDRWRRRNDRRRNWRSRGCERGNAVRHGHAHGGCTDLSSAAAKRPSRNFMSTVRHLGRIPSEVIGRGGGEIIPVNITLIEETDDVTLVAMLTVPDTVATFARAVIDTVGVATPTWMMLATDGTPEPLSINIIYSPGGLKFGPESAVMVSRFVPLVKVARTMHWLKLKW